MTLLFKNTFFGAKIQKIMIQAKEYPEKNSETEKVQLRKNEKAAAGILLMPTTAFPLFIYATTV